MSMFKIDEYFKSINIDSDIIKRFNEHFQPKNDSRLWLTPGHIIFTDGKNKVHTYDTRPYDFSTSPSETDSDELLVTVSPVLDIILDTENTTTRMFIVLMNGDVQIFEYRILLFEWARVGYFNVNIVSPNSNNSHNDVVSHVLISRYQNTIFWSEKVGNTEACFTLNKREIPLNGVREITQSAVGVPQKLLKNCTKFELVEIRDNICIIPYLPNSVNLYIILSARSHIWLFHIDGKLLFRGTIDDSPKDFISLCTQTLGLWSETGIVKVCKLLNSTKNYCQVLHNKSLVFIAPNGEITRRVSLNITIQTVEECYVMQNLLFLFNTTKSLQIFDISDAQLVQTLNMSEYNPISGIWCHSSDIPCLGFYSNNTIYKLNYIPLSTMLLAEPPAFIHLLKFLKEEHLCIISLLRKLINEKFNSCNMERFTPNLDCLQSKALLLAVLQSCREKDFKSAEFPFSEINKLVFEEKATFNSTKLKLLLDPLVECFMKFEETRISLCHN